MRLFAGPSLDKAIPDHSTILKFRHLLEQHGLARQIFEEVNQWLSEAGVQLKEGSLLDATIIEAPSSTKNKAGERDRNGGPPEMHQTKTGNECHFGMKAHIGVDVPRVREDEGLITMQYMTGLIKIVLMCSCRCKEAGLNGLQSASSRPRNSPNQLSQQWAELIANMQRSFAGRRARSPAR
ncbi:hypothetical protein GCM10011348_03530 [Marinobacterium nitratireducens]|uniref:Mobile element protein n=1 Tax=Marinobacterium nitratireducens TaxID=518897 RepID=A0A917Z974_9GAMM|nr:hypothetical protein GCM10011348_03530 [Marinobacterium nitratireducens]